VSPALSAASSRILILAILDRKGKSYGYEIIQIVRRASDGRLEWKDGMLYPVLHRMEREGVIVSEWSMSPEGRRRKYYRLLERGREELRHEAADWETVYNVFRTLWNPGRALT